MRVTGSPRAESRSDSRVRNHLHYMVNGFLDFRELSRFWSWPFSSGELITPGEEDPQTPWGILQEMNKPGDLQGSLVNVLPKYHHIRHASTISLQCRTDSQVVCYRGVFGKEEVSMCTRINTLCPRARLVRSYCCALLLNSQELVCYLDTILSAHHGVPMETCCGHDGASLGYSCPKSLGSG